VSQKPLVPHHHRSLSTLLLDFAEKPNEHDPTLYHKQTNRQTATKQKKGGKTITVNTRPRSATPQTKKKQKA
jgi:hypothetical protein